MLIKIKSFEKKCADQNKGLIKKKGWYSLTWQGGHGCAGRESTGAPPSASESSAGEVVAPA
jgi:hypothetical protein